MKSSKCIQLLILIFILASLGLAGCTPVLYGNTEVGDCVLDVAFINVVAQDKSSAFMNIDDDIRNQIEIEVVLQNIITERKYSITLSKDNSFLYEAKLFPGTYRVVSVESSMNEYTGMHVAATDEVVEIDRESSKILRVAIDNEQEFIEFQNNLVASDDIVMLPRFSRKLMISGTMVDVQDAMIALGIQSNEQVKPYAKCEIEDEIHGIELTVLNDSSSSKPASECKIIAIHIKKSTAMLPGGITLGMQAETICNKETGLYGEPTGFEGVAMYGQGLGDVKAIYLDNESGDKISLEINSREGYITGIIYELEVYE